MNQKAFSFLVSIRTLFHLATHRQCFVLKVNNFLQEKSSFNVFQQMLKMSHYKSKVFRVQLLLPEILHYIEHLREYLFRNSQFMTI